MNTIWFRRSLLTVFAALLALAPFSSALASPPEFSIVDSGFSFPIEGCSFPAEGSVAATLKVSVHSDQNGDFKMQIERVLDSYESYTNLATGKTLSSSKGAGIDKISIAEDGSVIFVLSGLIDIMTAPGQGLVVQDVGHFVWNTTTGEITFSAGQFTVHGVQGSKEALCAALE